MGATGCSQNGVVAARDKKRKTVRAPPNQPFPRPFFHDARRRSDTAYCAGRRAYTRVPRGRSTNDDSAICLPFHAGARATSLGERALQTLVSPCLLCASDLSCLHCDVRLAVYSSSAGVLLIASRTGSRAVKLELTVLHLRPFDGDLYLTRYAIRTDLCYAVDLALLRHSVPTFWTVNVSRSFGARVVCQQSSLSAERLTSKRRRRQMIRVAIDCGCARILVLCCPSRCRLPQGVLLVTLDARAWLS